MRAPVRRYIASMLYQHGYTQRDIAPVLGVHEGTLSRDFRVSSDTSIDPSVKQVVEILTPFYTDVVKLRQQVRELENRNRKLVRKLKTCREHRSNRPTAYQYRKALRRIQGLECRLTEWQCRMAELEDGYLSINHLNLSTRVYNCLARRGINTIPKLLAKSQSDIELIYQLGEQSLGELKKKVEAFCILHGDEVKEAYVAKWWLS